MAPPCHISPKELVVSYEDLGALTSTVRRDCHYQEGWGTFYGHVFEVPELCSATFEVHSSYIYVECSATVPDRDSRAQCPPGLEVDTVSIKRWVFNIFIFFFNVLFHSFTLLQSGLVICWLIIDLVKIYFQNNVCFYCLPPPLASWCYFSGKCLVRSGIGFYHVLDVWCYTGYWPQ